MTRWGRRLSRSRRTQAAVATCLSFPAALVIFAYCAPFSPPGDRLTVPGTVVLAADGTVLQRDTAGGLRIPIALDAVAPVMIDATVAAEDSRYWRHPGVDPIAVARAALSWRDSPSGASTITQQLSRRVYLQDSSGPRLLRKARESLLALQLEAHRSKREILQMYLNEVYYGRGAYGVEAAARVYFGTSAANLDLARASLLAGLPQIPAAYDRAVDSSAARARQRYVLDRLVAEGKVSRDAADEAAAAPLVFLPVLPPALAPHLVQFALDELARLRPDLAGKRGLVVQTTLDAGLQADAERSVRVRLEELRGRDATNAAVVVLDPRTGAVLAMVGSAGFESADAGEVNMALALRQPGSTLKPFLYAAALERGYTAGSPLLDVATAFPDDGALYAPNNADRRFHGPVTLRQALASSYNVPAVRTLDAIGIDAFLDAAHRFGLRTLTDTERYGLALTLGGGEVRLLDLAAAYGAIADGGLLAEPFAVARVRDSAGRVLYERGEAAMSRATSPEVAFLLADILADPVARVPGFGERSVLDTPFGAAVKTGTTTGWRDNWAVGFTRERVAAAWVGNADGSPMRDISGVDGAGPIWRDVMDAAVTGRDARGFPPPPRMVRASVCVPTGLRPGPDCPSPVDEWFIAGTEPGGTERYYARAPGGQLSAALPDEAAAWASDAGLRRPGAAAVVSVRLVAPADGAVFFVAPELGRQELLLRATAPGAVTISFEIDGAAAGAVRGPDGSVAWLLEPGRHMLRASAAFADGTTATTTSTYEVRQR